MTCCQSKNKGGFKLETIECKDVTKIIKKNKVIDHLSLTLHAGQIYGLQGINGSGKTMLMRLISGLIYPTSGSIFIDGEELGKRLAFPKAWDFCLKILRFWIHTLGFRTCINWPPSNGS